MRIVQLVANLDIGGLERQTIDLAQQQKLSGHDPRIYCLFHEGSLAAEAASLGIPVTPFHKPPGFSWATLRQIVRQLRLDRPDIVHTHNAVVHHYGAAAAKIAGVRVVVNTQHGTDTLTCDKKLSRIFNLTMPWTGSVVMVAESVRKDLTANNQPIPLAKTRVIHNGIRLAKFESHEARPGSHGAQTWFGTVGRLKLVKDHQTLISAFALVLAQLPGAALHIAGDGPLRSELEALSRSLGLEKNVVFHGARNDVALFLSTLDIFVLSSVTEGLPVAALEAMAVGLPIVSTRAGGAAEIASANITEFCEPSQPKALAEAMLRMARRPDLAELGQAARKLSRSHGVDRTWLQYEDLFQKLMAGESSPQVRSLPVLDSR